MPGRIRDSRLFAPSQTPRRPRLSPRQRGVLTAAGCANALIFFDQTSVVVALHSIQRDFHSSTVEVQWTIGAYLLSLAALVGVSGRLGDRYGRRLLFLVGVAVFGLASAGCAAAPSQLVLIVARFVQGAGAALTAPLVLTHATAIVGSDRRGWAIGVVASAGTSCLIIGPLLGGVLVDALGWRWIFLVNLPIAALTVVLALRFMPESRSSSAPALDLPGLLLLTLGLAAVVAGLLHMQSWVTALDAAVLGVGACALVAFAAVERRSRHPLLPLDLLRNSRVVVSLTALIAIQGSVLGVTIYLVLFLQNGLGFSATSAGGFLVFGGIWTPLLSRWTGRTADRQGAWRLIGMGLLVAALGLAAIGLAAPAEAAPLLLPGLLVFGVSRPFVFTPASSVPVKVLPASDRGLASSLVAQARQIGAVLGVAALGSITAAFHVHGRSGASAAGFELAMLAAAGACLAASVLAMRSVPRRAIPERAVLDAGTHTPLD